MQPSDIKSPDDVCQYLEDNFEQAHTSTIELLADNSDYILTEMKKRARENWFIYGPSGYGDHGAPQKLVRDVMEELADAVLYEVMKISNGITDEVPK